MNKLIDIINEDAANILRNIDISELHNKTILVTGASGMLGGYFLACLKLASNMAYPFRLVAVMQRKPPSYLTEFLDYESVSIMYGDLTNHDFCSSLPQADYIIHAAGYGRPDRYVEDPVKTLKLNTSTTFSLFERLSSGGKFLFVSSGALYNGLVTPPFKESEIGNTNTTHPRACYIEAKRCGEAIVNAYRAKGVKASSARLALAYGPGIRADDQRVIYSFIRKALNGQISLLDQGTAKRNYCYVSDAVEIMWKILISGTEPIYNIGGESIVTVAELAQSVGSYINVPVIFPSTPKSVEGAPDEVWLDMTKVREEFGKTCYVPIEEGVRRTIDWSRALYETAGEDS